jgi:hypothetical protein
MPFWRFRGKLLRLTLILVPTLAAALFLFLSLAHRQPSPVALAQEEPGDVRAIGSSARDSVRGSILRPAPLIPADAVREEELVVNSYRIDVWQVPPERRWEYGHSIVQVTSPRGQAYEIDWVDHLDPVSGRDITGEGNPDIVVERYSGGASCCVSYVVLDLGTDLTAILLPLDSPCEAEFRDLDDDGVPEVVSCDDAFRCRFCCCANSTCPTVVLRYAPGRGYLPAGPEFPEVYDADIPGYRRMAQRAQYVKGQTGDEQDPTGRCLVLPLVLAYLYSGRASDAWAELAEYYKAPDAEAFRTEIAEIVSHSQLFVTPQGQYRDQPLA